jgi:SAM-dependent methyltransferase
MNVCPDCNVELQDDSTCRWCGFSAKRIDGFLAFAPELAAGNDNYRASTHEMLFQLENNCFWFSERNKLIDWAMKKYFPNAESVLEIGCGTGYVLHGLFSTRPGIKYTGADIYTSGLKFAAERVPQANFIQMDARHIPFLNEFDVIGAFDVIEHVEEDQRVFDQIFKAVRYGGGVIITVPQHAWLWSATDDYACHKRRYTRAALGEKVAKSGFEVVKMVSFMSLLLPFIVVLRGRYLFCSKETIEKSVRAELRINSVLNNLFGSICMMETRMIQSGFSFPAGGSLMCIAKKRG